MQTRSRTQELRSVRKLDVRLPQSSTAQTFEEELLDVPPLNRLTNITTRSHRNLQSALTYLIDEITGHYISNAERTEMAIRFYTFINTNNSIRLLLLSEGGSEFLKYVLNTATNLYKRTASTSHFAPNKDKSCKHQYRINYLKNVINIFKLKNVLNMTIRLYGKKM